MDYRPLPVGVDDFEKLITRDYCFVDKTDFIKELLDRKGEVNLFTRPRRFGKTLMLSMLRSFFEDERDADGKALDKRKLFEGLKIMEAGAEYLSSMRQYPVINLTLKSAKQPDFDMAYSRIAECIVVEYQRHRYVLQGNGMLEADRRLYERIMNREAGRDVMAASLEFLSRCLSAYHGKRTVVLIDEYDVPLEHAFFAGFYEEMTGFIRSLFESALKTNPGLEFAVITGCLRISRESIFTGMNNLKIFSVLSGPYAAYFGFTEAEVEEMLGFYGLEDKTGEVKKWYDGYLFGNANVYNPWSVINYVDAAYADQNARPKPYWSNTSSNSIVRSLVDKADEEAKAEIEVLMRGGAIEKPVYEDITYEDIGRTQDNLWNFLFFTGYLKKTAEYQAGRCSYLQLAVPNEEVAYIYENTIRDWFSHYVQQTDFTAFYRAVLEGDCEAFADAVTGHLLECISYNDYKEAYYHGFLCGLLKGCKGYRVISNRESGMGRYDLVMRCSSVRGKALIMEIKTAETFDEMEAGCGRALEQIRKRNYERELLADGYRHIIKYGICFYRKECMVRKDSETQ